MRLTINMKLSYLQGTLQDVRLVSGPHGYLAQCPGLDSECPTCGQFSLLQATVQELTTHIHDLSLKVTINYSIYVLYCIASLLRKLSVTHLFT